MPVQQEADVLAGHDGPVLEAHTVVHLAGVPEDDVAINDVAVRLRRGRTADIGALFGALPGREPLTVVVGGDAEVLGGKRSALRDVRS